MRIVSIAIRNHSRLKDIEELEVRGHLILIGQNNSGKSSLLRCLDLLLRPSSRSMRIELGEEDFRNPGEPLVIEAAFEGFTNEEKALFCDPIQVEQVNGMDRQILRIRLEATVAGSDDVDATRYFPDCGDGARVSREQLELISWSLLGASGYNRDIREDRKSILSDTLEGIDLGSDIALFEGVRDSFQSALDDSETLTKAKDQLAENISPILRNEVDGNNLRFSPSEDFGVNPLSGIRLMMREGSSERSVARQSDGARAMLAIALYAMRNAGTGILAVDEPEAHLHPSSQRNLVKVLAASPCQLILATHSQHVIGAFDPESIVVFHDDGSLSQPKRGFLKGKEKTAARMWASSQLEPMTSTQIIAVEGPSDRDVLNAAAKAQGVDFDRRGISIVEMGGGDNYQQVLDVFGGEGFDIPILFLLDEDMEQRVAKAFGLPASDLESKGVFISRKDLESEYVRAIGPKRLWGALNASGLFSKNKMKNCPEPQTDTKAEADAVSAFCGGGNKTLAAIVAAGIIERDPTIHVASITRLLRVVKQ